MGCAIAAVILAFVTPIALLKLVLELIFSIIIVVFQITLSLVVIFVSLSLAALAFVVYAFLSILELASFALCEIARGVKLRWSGLDRSWQHTFFGICLISGLVLIAIIINCLK